MSKNKRPPITADQVAAMYVNAHGKIYESLLRSPGCPGMDVAASTVNAGGMALVAMSVVTSEYGQQESVNRGEQWIREQMRIVIKEAFFDREFTEMHADFTYFIEWAGRRIEDIRRRRSELEAAARSN